MASGGLINNVLDDPNGTNGTTGGGGTAGTGTSTTQVNGTDVLNANTTGYTADTRTVNQPTETASGQLNTLLSTGSPYLDLARGAAAQQANSRGLLNSSMAAGAGEAAAIGAALPIATHDADTYTGASRDNQAAVNTANSFNAGEANANARTNAAAGNTVSVLGAQTEAQQRIIGTQTEAQSRLQAEQAAHSESLTRVQGAIQSGLSAQDAIQREAQSRVDAELNAGLITTQEQANARLAQIQGQIQSGLSAQQAGQQSTLLTQQGQQQRQLETLRGQVETQLQTLRGTQSQDLAKIEANYRGLIQGNASASQLYSQSITMLSAVMGDTMTSTDQKQAAVDSISQMLQSGLGVIGSIANVDLTSLLNFNFNAGGTGSTAGGGATTTGTTTTGGGTDNLLNGVGA